jgi:hypothetical protein
LSNFEIIDRRQNKEHHVEPVKVVEVQADESGEWEDVAFVIALVQCQDRSMMMIGRAVGVRADGVGPFVADYVLPNVWPKGFDWPKEARKRLETFSKCNCTSSSRCSIHAIYLKQWMEADAQRMAFANSVPLPKAIELLMRAEIVAKEKAAKSSIVVPR